MNITNINNNTITDNVTPAVTTDTTPTTVATPPANMNTNNNPNRSRRNRQHINASNHMKKLMGLTAEIQVVLDTKPEKLNNQVSEQCAKTNITHYHDILCRITEQMDPIPKINDTKSELMDKPLI
eukprot:10778583-Ditylum_brightwellii.AAC.1